MRRKLVGLVVLSLAGGIGLALTDAQVTNAGEWIAVALTGALATGAVLACVYFAVRGAAFIWRQEGEETCEFSSPEGADSSDSTPADGTRTSAPRS